MKTVRVAFVGLGMRGPGAVIRFTHIPGVQIVALCDYERERAEKCQEELRKKGLAPADIYDGPEGYKAICAAGFEPALVEKVLAMTDKAEHKRRQGAIGTKITQKSFGRDRRYPLVNGWAINGYEL